MYIVTMIMNVFAPIGTFGLVATAFTNAGFGAIKQLGMYFVIVLLALFIHFFVVYGGAVILSRKILYGSLKVLQQLLGFSSSSSNQRCLSLECTKDMGVERKLVHLFNHLVQQSTWMGQP